MQIQKRKYEIRNLSKKTNLGKNAKICKSVLAKSIGLMFSKPKNLIFVFDKERIISLHMFFVFYPIDVVFLNKNKVVVELKKNFKPFRFYLPNKKAMYVIELPKNTLKETKTEVGDIIKF